MQTYAILVGNFEQHVLWNTLRANRWQWLHAGKRKHWWTFQFADISRTRSNSRLWAMNEIYREDWFQIGAIPTCMYVCMCVCAYIRMCGRCGRGWVQRKTNKAYRIDRGNPEHVVSLRLYISLYLSWLSPMCVYPGYPFPAKPLYPKPSSMSYVVSPGTYTCSISVRLQKYESVRVNLACVSLCLRADGLSQQPETLD